GPGAGHRMGTDPAGRRRRERRAGRLRPGGLAQDVGLPRLPHLRPDRAPLDLHPGPPRRGRAGPGDRTAGGPPPPPPAGEREERHGVFVDYNQNAKDRTVASAYSIRPTRDARVSTPLAWSEVPDCDPEAFTIGTVPERFARLGDPWQDMDDAAGSLDALLALADEHEAAGLGDAPWPPHYDKQADEPPRVQPSKRRAGGTPPPAPGKTSGPTGRRRSSMPLIEVARAASEAEALAGLERWKERHADVWPLLQPAH